MEELKKRGVEVVCEDLGDCYACYTKGNDTKVITLEKGITYFSKVMSFMDVPPGANCEVIYAHPKGYFVFSKSLGELAERVSKVLERLSA